MFVFCHVTIEIHYLHFLLRCKTRFACTLYTWECSNFDDAVTGPDEGPIIIAVLNSAAT
jgi:hypothetical protein